MRTLNRFALVLAAGLAVCMAAAQRAVSIVAESAFSCLTGYMSGAGLMLHMSAASTEETLALLKAAQANPDELIKSFAQPGTATTGLQAYNLEGPAKNLYPVLTPLRNSIARITGGFAIQANWKAITNINVGNTRAGLAEGKRGGLINHTLAEYLAAFRGFGLENNVTFEAQYAGKNFDDLKALSVSQLLSATMIQEERLILGGNSSQPMGTTPTPSLAASTTGGALATQTLSVICVALGLQAYLDVAGANNGAIGQSFAAATAVVPAQITRTNADGTTDTFGGGSGQKSAAATVGVTGATGSATGLVAAVNGASGYAWYWGAAGAEVLGAVTTVNSVLITATATGTQTAASLPAQDSTTSSLDFDGLLAQCFKPGSGAYVAVQANGVLGTGTGLTADGAGGVVEFETAFAAFYNKYRLSPTKIYLNSQELVNLTKKIIGNGGAPLLRLVNEANAATGNVTGGTKVGSYLNKITGDIVPIIVHPNMPAGTIFFFTERLPYPLSGVGDVVRMLMRQDYYQLEWPLRSRKYEYLVAADGVLQHYAPFSMGVITNIGNL